MFNNVVTKQIKPLVLGAVTALAVTGTTTAAAAAVPGQPSMP